MPGDPLSRYPAIHTSDIEEFERRVSDVYGATGLDVSDASALRVRANFIELCDCALGFGTCGTSVAIHWRESDFVRLQLALRGQCVTLSDAREAVVDLDRPVLTSAGRPATLIYGEGFEQLFLRVKSSALQSKLAALVGEPIDRELQFDLTGFVSPAMMTGLQRLIEMLTRQLDDAQARLTPLAVRELEQALVVQLLFAGRHDWSGVLLDEPREVAPVPVRRAEAYIEANWSQPIAIESLAEVAGVSARTLFRSFEKARGCSPMVFVKKIRLERARDLLSRPEGATSVIGIAFACGFLNPGHFASDYRKMFGELPSETLGRSKGPSPIYSESRSR